MIAQAYFEGKQIEFHASAKSWVPVSTFDAFYLYEHPEAYQIRLSPREWYINFSEPRATRDLPLVSIDPPPDMTGVVHVREILE